ncbi:putative RNA recognition motif domain, nucleotide-binding alpha-beta plait domain superfamily [Helianthus annuus]|nr:putative RNA recognition motif domain, nucleotide-binding alpha-beta plait domain superfamily [Helianthus annuus]KAJ0457011.1 putative RNA recognition motif domain, nucleotide-binding alpha-beta plait domain superfamily [Helianthus annuus]KAJ0649669.1 putative RNA recognition motif domain, nucleotide-binding alpha-beta plait domain superfamily [Helianthus annuus]KAJ0832416.1 putative RNA recognition motif domain, nucleotide-binding alpha-beta plait domain superfamily [Helianthus annuus]KAJ08
MEEFVGPSGVMPGSGLAKFYVCNLLDRCGSKDVEEFFRQFGEVSGVYIARKRDKWGNRFGFVSFCKVKDVKFLEKTVASVKMGNYALKANLARFSEENKEYFAKHANSKPVNHFHESAKGSQVINNLSHMTGPRSFKEVVSGGLSGNNEKLVEVSAFVSALKEFFDRALVGRVKDLYTLRFLDKFIKEAGGCFSNIKFLGGLSVLISFVSPEVMGFFLKSFSKESNLFSSLEIWKGQSLPFERLAWLSIKGVPLHLRENEVFDSVGRLYGKIIHPSQLDEDDGDLTSDMVGVIVGEGRPINEQVTLTWENKRFKVWVAEETSDWIPDFLATKNNRNVDEQIEVNSNEGIQFHAVPSVNDAGVRDDSDNRKVVEEASMHDSGDPINPGIFPRWEDGWNKGTFNAAQASRGADYKKR